MKRYLIGVLVVFLVIAGVILLLAGGSNKKSNKPAPVTTQKQIYDYAGSANATTVFTQQGHIVGDDQYRAIRITVARDYRRIDILDSYTSRVIKSKTFENDQAAFDVFLRALDHAGYDKTRKTSITDERGVCPSGYRFLYDMKDGSNQLQHTWSTSCSSKQGTSGGNYDTIRRLFQNQITDYNLFVRGVSLN